MLITNNIRIDLAKKGNPATINVMQNDSNSRCVQVKLYSDSLEWDVPDGSIASLAYEKEDGKSGWYDTLPDGSLAHVIEGNTIEIHLAEQVINVPGKVVASVVLFNDDYLSRIATFPFVIMVEKDPSAGQVISNNYYNVHNLGEIDAAIKDLQKQIDDLPSGGGGGGGDVPSMDEIVNAVLDALPNGDEVSY